MHPSRTFELPARRYSSRAVPLRPPPQRYVSRPALMHARKFDLRSFLLIASTNPVVAFYADGFIRRSQAVYSACAEGV